MPGARGDAHAIQDGRAGPDDVAGRVRGVRAQEGWRPRWAVAAEDVLMSIRYLSYDILVNTKKHICSTDFESGDIIY